MPNNMTLDTQLQLVNSSMKPLIVENGLLTIANTLAEKPEEHWEIVFQNLDTILSKYEQHASVVVRILANASCFGKCPKPSVATGTLLNHLDRQKESNIQELFFITLGIGNLSCDSAESRKLVHESRHQLLKVLNIDSDEYLSIRKNVLGTIANVTVDFQDIDYVKTTYKFAHVDENAAQTIVNCASRPFMSEMNLDFVNTMLCSESQEIQECGLDILLGLPGTCNDVSATQTLCWLADHICEDVQKKARRLVIQGSSTDIVSFIENGCIPVMWQLRSSANAETRKFANNLLSKLRSQMSPTVKKLLMRTLSMDGNESMRSHIATAMVHLCKSGGFNTASLDSILNMIKTPEGRGPALEFFCAIEAIFAETTSDGIVDPSMDSLNEDEITEMRRNLNGSNVLDTLSLALNKSEEPAYCMLRNHAFSYLIEDFEHLYEVEENRETIERLLKQTAAQAFNSM